MKIGDGVFHAIREDFPQGVEEILKSLSPLAQADVLKVSEENKQFSRFMTPTILAATQNNYRLLKTLDDHKTFRSVSLSKYVAFLYY